MRSSRRGMREGGTFRGMDSGRNLVLREFVRHRSGLFSLLLSIVRDFAFAEEAMQELSVVVCDQWADFAPGTNFQAWAMRIARNKSTNLTRRPGSSARFSAPVELPVDFLRS